MARRGALVVGLLAAAAAVFGVRALAPSEPATVVDGVEDAGPGAPPASAPALAGAPAPVRDRADAAARRRADAASPTARGADGAPPAAGAAADATRAAARTAAARGPVVGDGPFVVGEDGRAIVGATISSVGATGPAPVATTAADGRYDVGADGDPEAPLLVEAPGFVALRATRRALIERPRVVLRPATSIAGTVVDAETGAAVVGASVRAWPSSSGDSAQAAVGASADDGRFTLTVADAGAYDLEAGVGFLAAGEAPAADAYVRTRVVGVASGATDVVLRLSRGLSIEGTVVDDAGEPVRRPVAVEVLGRSPDGNPDYTRRKILRTADGTFAVRGIAAGRYDVIVRPDGVEGDAAGASVSTATVRDVEAGRAGLEVRLTRGVALVGRIVDGAGEPVTARGRVYVWRSGEPRRSIAIEATVPGDGNFRTPPLDPAFAWDLVAVEFRGYGRSTVDRVSPRDADVRIVLVAGKAIRGRVLDGEGKPVLAGVPVGWFAEGGDPRASGARGFAYTTDDGSFVVDGVPDLTFTLEAGGGRSGWLGEVAREVKAGAADVVLRASPGASITGTLLGADGQPRAASSLQADDGARLAAMRPYAQVGPDGRFTIRGLRAGPVRFSVRDGDEWVSAGTLTAPATDGRLTVGGG
ncbi:MAG: hypothetical protein IT460_13390 [Planctomycetes bacterium]|nr:hypothetical protein [Planctomycetota bacterium]